MLREQALAYIEMGRKSDALRCLERAVEIARKDHEALTHLAALHLEQPRWEAAEKLLLQSAALPPRNVTTQGCLAQLYAMLGRTDEAFAALARAVQLEPDQARATMACEPLCAPCEPTHAGSNYSPAPEIREPTQWKRKYEEQRHFMSSSGTAQPRRVISSLTL